MISQSLQCLADISPQRRPMTLFVDHFFENPAYPLLLWRLPPAQSHCSTNTLNKLTEDHDLPHSGGWASACHFDLIVLIVCMKLGSCSLDVWELTDLSASIFCSVVLSAFGKKIVGLAWGEFRFAETPNNHAHEGNDGIWEIGTVNPRQFTAHNIVSTATARNQSTTSEKWTSKDYSSRLKFVVGGIGENCKQQH